MNEIIKISNLSKRYKNIIAIQNLSLSIKKGQIYGILGPNGSGKTTTLSILTGIIHEDSGSFQWFGNAPSPNSLKRIGTLIESPNFYPYLSLYQNLKIIATIKSCPDSDISRVLGITNLLTRKHSKFMTLSLGMKQRLGIAATLLGDPEVLVLDEPTNGLDPEGIAEIREIIIKQAKDGKTILIASHILDEVEKVCTHVAILKEGKVISEGSVHALLSEDEIIHIVTKKQDEFMEALVREGLVKTIEKVEDEIVLSLAKGSSSGDLNEFAFKNGFVLEKIEVSKQSLESQFLELIK
ncbi:MAG: ATP-binding cassette domain-containing protein [Bacteroidales bacterium]|nr:ATP-binding cassette domain-containing protein [Bacteroidales bacterium]